LAFRTGATATFCHESPNEAKSAVAGLWDGADFPAFAELVQNGRAAVLAFHHDQGLLRDEWWRSSAAPLLLLRQTTSNKLNR
jgi:hypothetical protein